MSRFRRRNGAPVLGCAVALLLGAAANPVYAQQTLPNETPEKFVPRVESFDYSQREVMIPKRDGVKLQTVILIPRGPRRAPILLSRTPYGAASRFGKSASTHLSA
jgi:predicted acyl esterase